MAWWHGWGHVVVATSRRVSETGDAAFRMENYADHRPFVVDGARCRHPGLISSSRTSERRAALALAAEAVLDKQSSPVSARRHRRDTVQHQSPQRRAPICRLPVFVQPSARRPHSAPSTTTSCRCCPRSPRLIVGHHDDTKVPARFTTTTTAPSAALLPS